MISIRTDINGLAKDATQLDGGEGKIQGRQRGNDMKGRNKL